MMSHSQRAGVITTSTHLALQGVSREQAGKYSCTASNVEGDGKSQSVNVQVICKYYNVKNVKILSRVKIGYNEL